MAKQLYTSAANGLDTGDYAWLTGTWKVLLVTSAYTFSEAHDFRDDVTTGIVATGTISGRTKSAGVWDADDITFSGVAAGSIITAAILWKDTGVNSTSPLFMYDPIVTPLPWTTTGADFLLRWSDSAAHIFTVPTTLTIS